MRWFESGYRDGLGRKDSIGGWPVALFGHGTPDQHCYDRAMEDIGDLLGFVLAATALVIAVLAVALVMRRDRSAVTLAPGGARTAELERRLLQLGQRLEVVEADVDAQRSEDGAAHPTRSTFRTAGVAISHIGLVRFDAFDDTGGAQSFALALIDDDGDGIVLSSLHSRQTTRLYVKSIRRGVADAPLSDEEVQAMKNAGIAPTV